MTRIIAGTAGGRRLRTPPGDATRPTTDRVREALFSALESAFGGLDGLRVLDLFAGSGAIGLEALSRGAASAVLVERDARTAALVRRNAAELGLDAEVVAMSAESWVRTPVGQGVDVAFLDPPYAYADDALADLLAALRDHLTDDAEVVVERSSRSPAPRWPAGVEGHRDRTYGETRLWYGRA